MQKMFVAVLFALAAVPAFAGQFNLQHHEKRINAYAEAGKPQSEEFVRVHQGMKKGTYSYDLETARKVMREVYADRLPHAPTSLKQE